jgi:hypothetical protein
MKSSPRGLYALGYTHATMARHNGSRHREVKLIPQNESQFRSEAATRLREVGVASNRGSAHRGEYVPGPCTHRPSRHESQQHPKPVC